MELDDNTKLIVYELFLTKLEAAKYLDLGGLRIYPKDVLFNELKDAMTNYILKEKGKLL